METKNLEYLQKLSTSQELQILEYLKCRDDPYYFLTNWAYTLDVHDNKNPIKTFPEKKYIEILVKRFLSHKLLLVVKSRQMMVSWIFTGLCLWDAQFHKGRLIFFQSKKADDANDLVKRAKFIWDNEPFFLRRYFKNKRFVELKCNPQNNGQHIYNLMSFPDIHSEIRGIPEGGEILRMHTASIIFSDELAFQPEARKAYTASKPTISSKGKFIGVSTAEDGTFFESMVFDKI